MGTTWVTATQGIGRRDFKLVGSLGLALGLALARVYIAVTATCTVSYRYLMLVIAVAIVTVTVAIAARQATRPALGRAGAEAVLVGSVHRQDLELTGAQARSRPTMDTGNSPEGIAQLLVVCKESRRREQTSDLLASFARLLLLLNPRRPARGSLPYLSSPSPLQAVM